VCHESGFLGECVGRCHPGFGRRRRAVEFQDSLRRLEPAAVSRNKTSLATGLSMKKSSAAAEACGFLGTIDIDQSRYAQSVRCKPLAKTVAEKTQVRDDIARDRRKPLTAIPAQIKNMTASPNRVTRSVRRVLRIFTPGCCKALWFKHAFELLSRRRGARHSGRGGGVCALSARQSDALAGQKTRLTAVAVAGTLPLVEGSHVIYPQSALDRRF
jgi:hypothetical protein